LCNRIFVDRKYTAEFPASARCSHAGLWHRDRLRIDRGADSGRIDAAERADGNSQSGIVSQLHNSTFESECCVCGITGSTSRGWIAADSIYRLAVAREPAPLRDSTDPS